MSGSEVENTQPAAPQSMSRRRLSHILPTIIGATALSLTVFASGWVVGAHGHHWVGVTMLLGGLLASLILHRTLSARIQRVRHSLVGGGALNAWSAPVEELNRLDGDIRRLQKAHDDSLAAVRARHHLLQSAVDSMSEGVVAVDGSYRILFANASASEFFGAPLSVDEAKDRQLIDVIRLPLLHELVDRVLRGEETSHGECETGEPRRVFRLTVAPVQLDDLGRGAVATFSDETVLHALKRVRRDFVANVSHELRTPIASVQGWSETLLSGVLPLNEEARPPVERIHEGAVRLAELTEDLMTLARLDFQGADSELEEIEIVGVVEKVFRGLEERAAASGIRLTTDLSERHRVVPGTRRSWEYILRNLVDNAIKYGSPGGEVIVRTVGAGDRVRVEVVDDGPGIERQHIDRVFERFYRIDEGRGRAAGGSGLGLSIVRNYAVAIGGLVGVDSTPGRGATFWIELPDPARNGDAAT